MIIKHNKNYDRNVKYVIKIYGINNKKRKKKIISFLSDKEKEYNIDIDYEYIQIKIYSIAFSNILWFMFSILCSFIWILMNSSEFYFNWIYTKNIKINNNDIIDINTELPFSCSSVSINNNDVKLKTRSNVWEYIFYFIALIIIGFVGLMIWKIRHK